MSWQQAVDRTVIGLGYELVEVERLPLGLMRVTIDRIPGQVYPSGEGEFITVEDCEQVTRQLQYLLEVEGCDYQRLEVSSPGLDRLLTKPEHFGRFSGEMVALSLKMPFQGRKNYQGRLEAADAPPVAASVHTDGQAPAAPSSAWRIIFNDGKAEQALGFTLDEAREVRLVPVVNFKGRRKSVDAPLPESAEGDRQE